MAFSRFRAAWKASGSIPKDEQCPGAGAKFYKYDPAEAKKLLSAAGHSGPIQTKFTYATTSPQEEAAVLKEMWEKNGDFRLTSSVVDFVNEFRPSYSQNFDKHEGIAFSGAQGIRMWMVGFGSTTRMAVHVPDTSMRSGRPDAELNRPDRCPTGRTGREEAGRPCERLPTACCVARCTCSILPAPPRYSTWPGHGLETSAVFRSNQESWPAAEGWTHYWIDQSKKKS